MTLIYQIITATLIVLVAWNLLRERKLAEQITAALVLIPLILRVLMLK